MYFKLPFLKSSLAVVGTLALAPMAAAQAPGYKAESPVVVERGANGRALAVRVDGKVYRVCMTEGQDNCMQPRAAGLGWGDRPLQDWPKNNASEKMRGG
ncbi:hypothetical protein [Novosphingobium sp. M1R2S20]|uniref:Uncharacterized protein n=1 Tax=Novosphingobium rhizovicinum TaxID=3228928 RepID=A0ABV3R8Z1_9SPHN